jgi:ATP-dependent helicase HrpB
MIVRVNVVAPIGAFGGGSAVRPSGTGRRPSARLPGALASRGAARQGWGVTSPSHRDGPGVLLGAVLPAAAPAKLGHAAAPAERALPIDAVLPDVRAALRAHREAVVVAPPGAGKTTRLPLALLDEPWLAGRKIVLLEPRRLAARAAAERLAATLGEAVGHTIGLKVRFEAAGSAATRIEVVTEGVFVRMILEDPELAGIGAVLFDEYHERSLDADLGLALALDARALRPDLRLTVMSATLDGARVARLLDGAPLIQSQGRAFPVETRYIGRDPDTRIEDAVSRAILRALAEEAGSILAFLPGQAEIGRVAERLAAAALPAGAIVAPLYAAMDRRAQDEAVAPTRPGTRKIVLATSIAETSLTIEGVRVVVDSGLARVPRYEPGIGLTRLETQRVSRASADQRRGRAGRTEPGVCYRLWDEAGTGALDAFSRPAILAADMAGLLLDCAAWGARRPERDLAWLDPPPAPALAEARSMLETIGALDREGGLTEAGRAMRGLALPPRLSRMVMLAAAEGEAGLAAAVATLIVERGLGGEGADLRERLGRWRRDRSPRAADARALAKNFARQAGGRQADGDVEDAGRLLALAFPDRVAKARGKPGEYLMANGRAAALQPHDPLAGAPYLAIADVAGRAGAARILLAAPISETDVLASADIVEADSVTFDPERAGLRARRTRRLGAILLSEGMRAVPPGPEAAACLAAGLAREIGRLPWTPALRQWRDRVMFLRGAEGADWPDLSDAALSADGAPWLAPHLDGLTSLAGLGAERLEAALASLLPWDLARRLDADAPAFLQTPAGARHRVDYVADQGPTLSVKVQELYGLMSHPTLARGRVPVVLELLSPGGRPIQITRDLPGFWRGSWSAVRSEMRGRYPKHLWPEDPGAAAPTLRAKPRA